jgi:hypothetical protein
LVFFNKYQGVTIGINTKKYCPVELKKKGGECAIRSKKKRKGSMDEIIAIYIV